MIVYALPYAAGSASCFYKLKQMLSQEIEFVPLELSGHGARIRQKRACSVQKMAEDAFNQLLSRGVHAPYCLMGYSMGSSICYELYQLLFAHHCALPRHMIMCASDIPTHRPELKNVRRMSDIELREELSELGGTPKEILENKELLELVLPIVRDDFIAVEEYRPSMIMKMKCGGTIICGTQELDKDNEFEKWTSFFTENVNYLYVEGGHFFLNEKPEKLANYINTLLFTLEGKK